MGRIIKSSEAAPERLTQEETKNAEDVWATSTFGTTVCLGLFRVNAHCYKPPLFQKLSY